jgi:hypothetical protein
VVEKVLQQFLIPGKIKKSLKTRAFPPRLSPSPKPKTWADDMESGLCG